IFAARSGAELECKQKARALRNHQEELTHLYTRLQDTNRYLEQQIADRTQEIERRRLVAESLRDMVLILNSNHPLSEILDYIVATATQLLSADSGAIYSLEQDQQTLVIQAARGLPAAYAQNLSFAVERSFLGQAILRRQPIVFSNLAEALSERDIDLDSSRRVLLAEHYQTLLAIPLLRQTVEGEIGEVFGGIALYYPQPHQFSDEEIRLSVAFGAQAALAIENARLRQQVEQMAVQEERSRLSRELHDSVTQSLYSLTLLAEGWRRLAKNGRLEQIDEALTELGQIAQQALREMRLLVYALRPLSLEEAGLIGALHQRLNAVEKRSGVDARLVVTDVLELPAPVENCLYRIAQEALNNSLKHAVATAITVRVAATTGQVTLEVTDNGRGFAPALAHESPGIGLSSMRERAEKLGGTVTILSAPGQGTTVRVQMPLLSVI
ncbi:MAG: GAF domain-containing sensor histidine kinase, partial [Anaerolineales bacterium]|nr:GAF domain-containing sensor histidine kinase [Anaerolineales bacterium]